MLPKATRCVAAFLAVAIAAVVPAHADEAVTFTANSGWTLQLPEDDTLVFHGVVSLDSVGMGSGSMLYPAPNAGGFIAALITHAVLIESTKNSQKQKMQEEADKVLLPYRKVLEGYRFSQAMQRALEKSKFGGSGALNPAGHESPAAWHVEVAPVFWMTQDERALILDAAVVVKGRNQEQPTIQQMVRVVSQPREEEAILAQWNGEDGLVLKETAAALMAHALDIALDAPRPRSASEPVVQKTFRYPAGAIERFERAEFVAEGCHRLIVRNLRGTLMSIPVKRDAAEAPREDCVPV